MTSLLNHWKTSASTILGQQRYVLSRIHQYWYSVFLLKKRMLLYLKVKKKKKTGLKHF